VNIGDYAFAYTRMASIDLSGVQTVDSMRKARAGVDEQWKLFLDSIRTIRKMQV